MRTKATWSSRTRDRRRTKCCWRAPTRIRCAPASTRLEGGQKQAIALAFVRGLSHAELAHHLRQPLGTVKSWVRRGLERLRQCLEARASPRDRPAMNLGRPDRSARLDALAAAYALGTLGAAGAAPARRAWRCATRPSRRRSATWEWRLAALAEAMPGVTPPPRVWEGIRARLGLAGSAASRRRPAARSAGGRASRCGADWPSPASRWRSPSGSRCSRRAASGRSKAWSSCWPGRTRNRCSSRPPSAAAAS